MIKKMFVLSLAGACLVNMACSSAPKPPMLDGGERTPINSIAKIQDYIAASTDHGERIALAKQVEGLNRQVAVLRSYLSMQLEPGVSDSRLQTTLRDESLQRFSEKPVKSPVAKSVDFDQANKRPERVASASSARPISGFSTMRTAALTNGEALPLPVSIPQSIGSATVGSPSAVPLHPPGALPETPADRWEVLISDVTLAKTFARWAQVAGYRLRWDAARTFVINAPSVFNGTFEAAVGQALDTPGIQLSDYPLEVCLYANNPPLLRVTRQGDQAQECAAVEHGGATSASAGAPKS